MRASKWAKLQYRSGPIQSSEIKGCAFNLGNVLHRLGRDHYLEAEQWLQLSTDICEWMELGRYDALAEMILAKIGLELGNDSIFQTRINRAELIAKQANNPLDQSWCHTLRAKHFMREGQEKKCIRELVCARRLYSRRSDGIDTIRDEYHASRFGALWDKALIDLGKG
jgi:hypothetical protein